jgi:hypothetical protein
MIAPADKGNSIVVLPIQNYDAKIQDFINKNNFQLSTSNPTKTFQNQIRKTINHSPNLIPSGSKWKFINLNPSAPDQITQTKPPNFSCCQLAQCPSLQAI